MTIGSEVIKSKDNPNIKLYQKLSASKKERSALGMFVLEGMRIIMDAVREKTELVNLMVTVNAAEKYESELSQVDLGRVNIVIISNELGSKIASTEKTQGVFAVCRIPQKKDFAKSIKEFGRYIVLYQLQDPGNAGMIIRTADALGVDGIIMSESCDLFSPKVIRSTMGSIFRVPVWYDLDINEIIQIFNDSNMDTFAAVVDNDACNVKEVSFENGGAVLIGNEGNGLPKDVADKCTRKITIKMYGNINSLNAAMAAGIISWELMKSGRQQDGE